MIEEFTAIVPAPAGAEERIVSVYIPKDGRPCAVLYLFDGQTAFFDERSPYGGSLRLGEFLDANGIPLLVVGVACDRKNRLTEYSPFPFRVNENIRSEGKGKVFMDWLTGTLKPHIDGRYGTYFDRAHTFIMGSSMGGLMAMYALAEYGHIFSRAVSMSAAVWTDPEKSAAFVKKFAPDAALYFDYGTAEMARSFPTSAPRLRRSERRSGNGAANMCSK